jgi:hypothetical protein
MPFHGTAHYPPHSINSWDQLEDKFNEHFFTGNHELKLVNLTSLRQGREEWVTEYFKRFRDTRNRCFGVALSKTKPCTCTVLQPINKNRQREVRFTFNVAKCDKIFDELLKSGNIGLSHTILPLDELKRRAYFKWHILFLMQLMIVIFFSDRCNRPSMRDDLTIKICRLTSNPSRSTPLCSEV